MAIQGCQALDHLDLCNFPGDKYISNTNKKCNAIPVFGKIGPVAHHASAKVSFLLRVVEVWIEWFTENVTDFVAVHYSRPLRPWIALRPMTVLVHVHIHAFFGVPACVCDKLHG